MPPAAVGRTRATTRIWATSRTSLAVMPRSFIFRCTLYGSLHRISTSTDSQVCCRNSSRLKACFRASTAFITTGPWLTLSVSYQRSSSAYASGSLHLKASSSSSSLMRYMPSSLASGANTSSVSSAMRLRLCGASDSSVRMLCSRSASLTMMTRTSSVMAMNICCRSSAFTSDAGKPSRPCLLTLLDTLLTFVSPSTMRRTAGPKRCSMNSNVTCLVSSTVSCSSPAMTVSWSIPMSPRMQATATGWVMKGSPDLRSWPSWAWNATCRAARTSSTSAGLK